MPRLATVRKNEDGESRMEDRGGAETVSIKASRSWTVAAAFSASGESSPTVAGDFGSAVYGPVAWESMCGVARPESSMGVDWSVILRCTPFEDSGRATRLPVRIFWL